MTAGPSPRDRRPAAVYFASDYGTADEFVGVVHAVLHRLAPGTPVIDLSHEIPPFDVAAGAELLVRCAPVLGAGVVLAVVDPTVGTTRRALALRVDGPTGEGPGWLVGPDNGLLLPLADACGGVRAAHLLERSAAEARGWPVVATARTFDGRDLFAPAAAHLVAGGGPGVLGPEVDHTGLARLPVPSRPEPTVAPDGGLLARVRWADRFGNLQLDLVPEDLEQAVPAGGTRPAAFEVVVESGLADRETAGDTAGRRVRRVRRVSSFSAIGPGEVGLVVDANGRLALAADRDSAARLIGAGVGDHLRLRPVPG